MEKWHKNHPNCMKNYKKKYRKNNIEKIKEYKYKWEKDNSEKVKGYIKKWEKNNPEKVKEQKKRYHKNNFGKMKEKSRKWYENNRVRIIKQKIEYQKDNKEKIKKHRNYRYKIDLKYNLTNKIRRIIALSLKGNKAGRHWEDLVGYTLSDLIEHLKKTMPEGYCWQDYIEGRLHIDHKIPISAFHFSKPGHPDFQRCWTLKNLQLLPAEENMIKGNKLSKPFQPALKISIN